MQCLKVLFELSVEGNANGVTLDEGSIGLAFIWISLFSSLLGVAPLWAQLELGHRW